MVKKYILSSVLIASVFANETIKLEGITVIARQDETLKVYLDPKSPIQPLPPLDGAGLLKSVPNFSVTRKGGSSGDPLFRGLGGSRLAITSDDSFLYGGCGGRMDPPTAYIFPNSYDRVVITKGPQSVIYPGIITGAVQFLRDDVYFQEPGAYGETGLTAGSFGRFDAFADVTAGAQFGYMRIEGMYNKQDDYKDGGKEKVHSEFERNSQTVQLGLTPNEYALAEFTYDRSRGRAAYADRMMDGSKFDKDAYKIKLSKDDISDTLKKVNFQYGYSYIDHVMDNYNLRENSMSFSASNPDRRTKSASLATDIAKGLAEIKIGIDWQSDEHRGRSANGMNKAAADAYKNKDRVTNQKANNIGVFAEANFKLTDEHLLVAGVRRDRSEVDYFTNGQKSKEQDFNLNAAFLRYEYYSGGFTYFGGVGFAQRAPDFWERNRNKALNKESNLELDAGILYKSDTLRGSFNVFASEIDDFILVYANTTYSNSANTAENIDARRYGFEGEAEWEFVKDYKLGFGAAYTYGKNKSGDKTLGQTPPLELKGSFGYDNGIVSAAILARYVAAKRKIAKGEGNIIGQDIAENGDFAVFSINGSWKINKNVSLFLGVDNIFDEKYSEFISKGSYDVSGYNQPASVQIHESGRQFWASVQGRF
ncbi:MAG: TonB-dependent copper receptor [Campylobacteraceae bacterium]|jgi:iron complex outermembrane receptor protein|nr:TonB-dependent copper receptor [Campylobacteraceae bacterium]